LHHDERQENRMNIYILSFSILAMKPIIIPGLLFIIMIIFFVKWMNRDPERIIPAGNGLILSAADGRVSDIENVKEQVFLKGNGVRIGVYLSLMDVHVNRIPVAGVIRFLSYAPGAFYPAHTDKSSDRNEHHIIGIENDRCKILVKQIAGTIARRIVCRLHLGDVVQRGERFGKITLGSRVELIVPTQADIRINVGDRVRAGETIIGVME